MPYYYPDDERVEQAPTADLIDSAERWAADDHPEFAGPLFVRAYARDEPDAELRARARRGAARWLQSHDRDEALRICRSAEQPGELTELDDYRLWIAILAQNPPRVRQALDVADRATARFPDDPAAHVLTAWWRVRLGEPGQAGALLRGVSWTDHLAREAYMAVETFATIARDLESPAEELDAIEHIGGFAASGTRPVGANPSWQAVALFAAATLVDLRALDRAEALIGLLGEPATDELREEGNVVLSGISSARSQWREVIDLLSAIPFDRLGLQARLQLASARAQQGDFEGSMSVVDQTLHDLPDDPSSHVAAVVLHWLRYFPAYVGGRFDEAWISLLKVRELAPQVELDGPFGRSIQLFLIPFTLPSAQIERGLPRKPAGWETAEDRDYAVGRLAALHRLAERVQEYRLYADAECRTAFRELTFELQNPPPGRAPDVTTELNLNLAYVALLANDPDRARQALAASGVVDARNAETSPRTAVLLRAARSLSVHIALAGSDWAEQQQALLDAAELRRENSQELEYHVLYVHALVVNDRHVEAEAIVTELCEQYPGLTAAELWRAELLLHTDATRTEVDASANPDAEVPLASLIRAAHIYADLIRADQAALEVLGAEKPTERHDDDAPIASDLLNRRETEYIVRRGLHAVIRAERIIVSERLPRDPSLRRDTEVLLDRLEGLGPAESAEAARLERLARRPRRRRLVLRTIKVAAPVLVLAALVVLLLSPNVRFIVGRLPSELRILLTGVLGVLLAWPYVREFSFSGLAIKRPDVELPLDARDRALLTGVAAGSTILRLNATPPPNVASAADPKRPHAPGRSEDDDGDGPAAGERPDDDGPVGGPGGGADGEAPSGTLDVARAPGKGARWDQKVQDAAVDTAAGTSSDASAGRSPRVPLSRLRRSTGANPGTRRPGGTGRR
ncbi:hypothetical protein ACDF64_04395 [Agromyces sp. MMS24-JH15]|uniref:hypothetical protein n=1 Tax=Agromyces sp. MMS24-JH15 TaxID=3243765 RepID=UPI0037499D55